jgi:hypothetical protein
MDSIRIVGEREMPSRSELAQEKRKHLKQIGNIPGKEKIDQQEN